MGYSTITASKLINEFREYGRANSFTRCQFELLAETLNDYGYTMDDIDVIGIDVEFTGYDDPREYIDDELSHLPDSRLYELVENQLGWIPDEDDTYDDLDDALDDITWKDLIADRLAGQDNTIYYDRRRDCAIVQY